MNCPVCTQVALTSVALEEGLRAHRCETCGGVWMAAIDYLTWRSRSGAVHAECEPMSVWQPVPEGSEARLCPRDEHILLKYKVGHGITFLLDRCGTCNGIWLDRHEWETLKCHGLHGEVHSVFTAPWQHRVRQAEQRRALEIIYSERFGTEDYAELRRVKAWLDGHAERSAVLAYLSQDDPYQIK